jgi:hypothetical protein
MRFYLNRGGEPEGPLEEAAIFAMIQRGEVTAAAYICPEGGQAWQPLHSHAPFAAPPKPIAATVAMDASLFQAAAAAAAKGPVSAPGAPISGPGQYTPAPAGFSPAPYSAPGGVQVTAPYPQAGAAAAAQKPKSKLGLILGGGCGLIVAIAMCGGGGALAYTMFGGDDFPDEINSAAEDLVATADRRTSDVSDTWSDSGTSPNLSSTEETDRATFDQLGDDPEIVLTGVELIAHAGAQSVRTIAVVFPDGEVRYSGLNAEYTTAPPTAFPRDTDAQRHLAEAVDELVRMAADDCESIELLERDQIEDLPAGLRDDIMRDTSETDRRELCDAVARNGEPAFTVARVTELTTIVRGNGRYALLASRLTANSARPGVMYLEPVRVRMVEESTPPPQPTGEMPVTNSAMDPRTVEPCVTECGGAQNTACWQPCLDRRAAEINRRVYGTP